MHPHVRAAFAGAAFVVIMAQSGAPARAQTEPPPGGWLPDSMVIAHVDDRRITVLEFRDDYFSSAGEFRPAQDSLGRASFLKTLVNKEVLGLTALEIGPEFDFGDRQQLREHERSMLLSALYQRAVADSSVPTEEEIERYAPQFGYEVRVRQITFTDYDTAVRVRKELVDGKIKWRDAVKRYSILRNLGPEGDVDWVRRNQLRGEIALETFSLQPGEISRVLWDGLSWFINQGVERREVAPPPAHIARRLTKGDLRDAKGVPLVEALFGKLRQREGAVYDTANIVWTIQRFREALPPLPDQGLTLDLRSAVPDIGPADTSRTLIHTKSRRYTVKDFVDRYGSLSPLARPPATSLLPFLKSLDLLFFEPQLVEEARARGLENDPLVIRNMERKREELAVHHVYSDSIVARVRVDRDAEHRYYDENLHTFFSVPQARYIILVRPTAGAADSLKARLDAGASPELLVAADSSAGLASRTFQHRDNDPQVASIRKLLFEDMKPGQSERVGPDQDGNYAVVHLLEYVAPRQMAFDEVEDIIYESLYNMESERLLNEFLERHAAGRDIGARYDLVMRIKMTDPVLDAQ